MSKSLPSKKTTKQLSHLKYVNNYESKNVCKETAKQCIIANKEARQEEAGLRKQVNRKYSKD